MRVTVADPPAYTPPYDHALCEALADRGLDVTLATSHFRFGAVPAAARLPAAECFYRRRAGQRRGQGAAAPARHAAPRAAPARRAGDDVVHFQWLPIPNARPRCWCARFPRPVVLTAHDVTPREVRPERAAARRRVLRARGRGRRALAGAARGALVAGGGGAGRARARDPARRVHAPRRRCPRDRRRPRSPGWRDGASCCSSASCARTRESICWWRRSPARRTTSCCWWSGMPRMPLGAARAARARARHRRPRAVRAALRARRRPARLLPARRPGRAALPRDRAVGRALHGARVRHAAAAERGRRLPRDRASTAPRGWSSPATSSRCAQGWSSCSTTSRRGARCRARRWRSRPASTRGSARRRSPRTSTGSCWRSGA